MSRRFWNGSVQRLKRQPANGTFGVGPHWREILACRITSRSATSSNFKRAKLKRALLLGLDLQGATFQGAHFDRTVLNGCDLRAVDLSSVRLLRTMVDGVTIPPEQSDTLLKALDVQVVATNSE